MRAVLGALLGGRRSARSIATSAGSLSTRHGMSTRARERKETAEHRAQQAADDLQQLEEEILDEVAEIDEEWRAKAAEIETVSIRLEATDVQVVETRLVWSCQSRIRSIANPRRARRRPSAAEPERASP